MYSEAFKIVKPKKEKVALMQSRLDADMEKLRLKQFELREVQDHVTNLQQQCKDTEEKVATLQKEIIITQQRLERARKLLDLLADEGIRWEAELVSLNSAFPYLYGNVFLSVAAISYLGPFTGNYRKKLTNYWSEACSAKKILCDSEFSLERVIGVPVIIRNWNIAGLPSDQFSIENGILALNSPRWPLMIDPQNQAHKWIKNLEKDSNLIIIKSQTHSVSQDTKEYIRNLEYGLSNGLPVLLEDADESIDRLLDNILCKNYYKTDVGRTVIRLGDSELQYDSSFRFYITTKLPNPHYLPEISVKVNIINFTVSFAGLEEQLLADIVRLEKPEIEAKKNDVIVTMARDKKLLDETQHNILEMIAVSTGYVLDNVKLIAALERSKHTSKDIKRRLEISTEVERVINETREKYRSVAIRGSVLYFVVADMSHVDPMYQYSLEYIKRLFNNAIANSEQQDSIEGRIKILTDDFTKVIYTNICRGLFEIHKVIFSFLIGTSIERKSGNISEEAWNILIRGAYLSNKPKIEESLRDLLTTDQLELLKLLMDNVPAFFNFKSELQRELRSWLAYKQSESILEDRLPGDWEYKLNKFERLLLIKLLRPEKLMDASEMYIDKSLGSFYTESPSVSLDKVYDDSDCKTPIIFVLSQGADPVVSVQKLAKSKGLEDKLIIKSLGQGQGPKAKDAIERGKLAGNWVVLQNCHLAKSWMPQLEKIVESLRESSQVSSGFRLILTSMPADYFPVSVLQIGLKVTTELPRGVKSNIRRTYQDLSDDFFDNSSKPEVLKKMMYSLCFFHAIVQERRKYGALGFNISYRFSRSDLETSMTMLKLLIEESEDTPWDALIYITGNINYGGRVTDDWDRTCLLATLKKFYNPEIFEDEFTLSESGRYKIPELNTILQYKDYINTLPSADETDIFGLHSNANITYQLQESNKFLNSILEIQPRIASGGNAKSSDEIVKEVCKNLIVQVPAKLDISTGHPDLFIKAEYNLIPSLSTVLFQEIERFNKLTALLKRTLNDLIQAIQGEILMSEDLDSMYSSLMNSQVPAIWHKISYPSLKPLGSWMRDLNRRVAFMSNWLMNGNPACYWISGFFYPQSFITGVLQTHSRRYSLSIDSLSFSFSVLDRDAEEINKGPYDGVYVYGLYLEGARWDRDERQLSEQLPGELYSQLPAIHFLPESDYLPPIEDYSCPVYKTSARAGELSTTGQSTNFILSIDLPSEEQPEHWTLRGAAMLCQLDE
jgi:dynein heavy chain